MRLTYPVARTVDQTDDYHGTLVPDPYRWLEDVDSPETLEWIQKQNALTFSIFRDGLEDRDYLERFAVGGAELRQHVRDWTPSRASEATDLAAEEIEAFAREYATTRPSAIRMNYGLNRHAGGGMAVRTIACLPAVTGAWREVGGGVLLSTSGFFPVNSSYLERPDLIRPGPRTLNMVQIGRALTSPRLEPRVMAVYVYNSNPLAVAPEQASVRRGFRR